MALTLGNITFDCGSVAAMSKFWSEALERPVDDGGNEFFATIDDHVADRPSWFFVRVPESKTAKNRVHLDLGTEDREQEVARLLTLGATRIADHNEWGAVWTVMTDVEGNEFCVAERSEPE
jgi:hypothetical protein